MTLDARREESSSDHHDRAEVTAVIPTALRRRGLLDRALTSVRRQDGVSIEIVVVADVPPGTPVPDLGADVTVLTLAGPQGACAARNAGARVARGRWIAFLDDDDEWTPGKLDRQLATARQYGDGVIVSSRFQVVTNGTDYDVLPRGRRLPGQDLSEYLFCRRLPSGTVGLLPTSTLLADADLVRRCRFSEDLAFMHEADWVLHATRHHGAAFVQLTEPLMRWHIDDDRDHVSGSKSWRTVVAWVEANGELLTPRSAAGAVLMAAARTADGRRQFPSLVRAAFSHGRPRALDLAASTGTFLVSRRQRWYLARLWGSLVRRWSPVRAGRSPAQEGPAPR